MLSPSEMSDAELLVAIANELTPRRWINVRIDDRGKVIADPSTGLSELPLVIPNCPLNIRAAAWLEEQLKEIGLQEVYTESLLRVSSDPEQATARQRSEAALMTLREASSCVA